MATTLKVGALAKRTGLTVRTLHHYDDIGLLSPSSRTQSGHRLYRERDVERLQQIASLKHLGLGLEEIKACLTRPEYTLEQTLDLQIERIEEQIARQTRMRDLLTRLRARLGNGGDVSVDDLTRTIEVTMSYEKYYTPEQLEQLRERGARLGEERIREVQREWQELFAACGSAMERGLDPDSEEVMGLARRWSALIEEFTGGDPGIAQSLTNLYRGEGAQSVMASQGMEVQPGLFAFMGKARAALERD